ncbi:hypothetical protein J6P92_02590 [bacterium]|nr:hypothetical protein [bacterium]
MNFLDIKQKEIDNYVQIIKQSADKAKCIKELVMRSKSPKYQHELLDLFMTGEIPSASTITQMTKKIYAVVASLITLFHYSSNVVSFDDIWNAYEEIIDLKSTFPFLDLDEARGLLLDEVLPF